LEPTLGKQDKANIEFLNTFFFFLCEFELMYMYLHYAIVIIVLYLYLHSIDFEVLYIITQII